MKQRDRQDAQIRLEEVGLALTVFRHESRRCPDSLSEFIPCIMLLTNTLRWLATACVLGLPACSSDSAPAPSPPPAAAPSVTTPQQVVDRYADLVLRAPHIPDVITGELRRLNEQLSSGLDPRENAAVWLVQALGAEIFPEDLRPHYLEMLGIETLSPARGRFRSIEDFIAARVDDPDLRGEYVDSLTKTLEQCEGRPWTVDQVPLLAEYLEYVADPLETALDGMRKPRYAMPLVSLKPAPNIAVSELFLEYEMRPLVRALVARAQMRAASGDVGTALDEMIAIRRLGVLFSQGGLCLQNVLACGYESQAYYPERDWIERARQVGVAEARRHLQAIRGLPPLPPPGNMFDAAERAALLDGIAAMKAGTWHSLDAASEDPERKEFFKAMFAHSSLQWDVITSSAVEEFDRMRDAINEPDRQIRQQRVAEAAERLDSWKEESPRKLAAASFTASLHPVEASRTVGRSIALIAMPAYGQVIESRDRLIARAQMREISLALLIFRYERGAYPDSLSELAPDFFPAEPLDPYTGHPLSYRKTGPDSCRLWSWGQNGIDDDGRPNNRERTTDDWPVTLGGSHRGESPDSGSSAPASK